MNAPTYELKYSNPNTVLIIRYGKCALKKQKIAVDFGILSDYL